MPKGVRIPDAVRQACLRDYYAGLKTVDVIAAEHGVHRRRIYDWTRADKRCRVHNERTVRRGLHVSLDETELLLLIIGEAEKIIKPDQLGLLRSLEDRLLQIADDLWELQNSRTI